MKNILKIFGAGKSKRIRAMRMKHDNKPKIRFNNPYFPNERKVVQKEFSFKNWFIKDGWAFFGILILTFGSLIYIGFGTKYFIINNIEISGNDKISTEEINNYAQEYLNSKKLFIIPKNNYFVFNIKEISSKLQQNINNKFALDSLAVNKKWPNQITITIQEKIPGLTWNTNNQYYYVDLLGKVSQKINSESEIDPKLPLVIDKNNANTDLNQQIISEDLIQYIMRLQIELPKIGLNVVSYSIPIITCNEQQYKAERIINDEIAETVNEEIKNKKKDILEKYNNGDLTIEESLLALEDVKKEEDGDSNINSITDNATEFIQWESILIPKECDYKTVNKTINVLIDSQFEIYFDSTIDLDRQTLALNSLLTQKIDNRDNLQYIDLRFKDRIYYK
ncbi:MAG: FtsQ-type POTRA domain-containing protein [Patescibacteria group bacterium]